MSGKVARFMQEMSRGVDAFNSDIERAASAAVYGDPRKNRQWSQANANLDEAQALLKLLEGDDITDDDRAIIAQAATAYATAGLLAEKLSRR